MADTDRLGMTSRIVRLPGPHRTWLTVNGDAVELPVMVDLMEIDPETHEQGFRVEAVVDLVDGQPAVVRLDASDPAGLQLERLQFEFRWSTPLDIVTVLMPRLLAAGIDPYTYDVPVTGFPEAADPRGRSSARLPDSFLEEIAREYLAHGRGYAAWAAEQRHVSQRTVTSWIEKARRRGILTEVPRGSFGGHVTTGRNDA